MKYAIAFFITFSIIISSAMSAPRRSSDPIKKDDRIDFKSAKAVATFKSKITREKVTSANKQQLISRYNLELKLKAGETGEPAGYLGSCANPIYFCCKPSEFWCNVLADTLNDMVDAT